MEISQLTLAWLCLYAFVLGTELGAVYDAICVTRVFLGVSFTQTAETFFCKHTNALLRPGKRLFKKPLFFKVVIFIEDFLFSVCGAISVILLFYRFNNGKIRFPVLLCILLGFLLYRCGPGRFIKPILEIAVVILKNVCTYTIAFLLFPFKKITQILKRCILSVYGNHVKNKERKQRIRFTKAEKRRIDQDFCGML